MAKALTTQKSLKHLRELGFHCWIVEHWNSFAHIRQDMFGFVDLCCVSPKAGNLWVQTTTQGNMGARIAKARGNPALVAFLICGGSIEVHGWHKIKNRWQVSIKRLTLDDLIAKEEESTMTDGATGS